MITRPQNPSIAVLLFSLKGSIVTAIWRKVLFTVLVSSAIVASHGTLYHYKITLTATPFTLWGLTLAICLGFRNTVAYQRFWEARMLWGELMIVTRNLTRQLLTLLPTAQPEERRSAINLLLGFGYALKDQLRGDAAGEDLQRLLDEPTHRDVLSKQNPCSVLLHRLSERISSVARQAGASDMVQVHLDEQVTRLSYVLGGCERIKNTPIPYPYILMLHRIVHLYCFLLPFCLVDAIGWFTPLAVCVLAYTFFGLDALGDQIADPFDTQPNDLPLNAMCRNQEIAVLEMLGEPAPAAPQPIDGVLL